MVTMPCRYTPKQVGKSFGAVDSPMHLLYKRSSVFYISGPVSTGTGDRLSSLDHLDLASQTIDLRRLSMS